MRVAIVGTGISGVTLALRLQQLGVGTTVLTDRSPAEQRQGRIENLVARFPATRERERLLGVDHWADRQESLSRGIEVAVAGTPVRFRGRLDGAAQAVDFRLYLSRLLEDYAARGGAVETGPLPVSPADLAGRTAGHDVVVVAAGRSAPVARALFPVRRDRTPYEAPPRRLLAGLWRGVGHSDPPVVGINLVPGEGEIFCQPMLTAAGVVSSILVEAVPGGALEPVTRLDPDGDQLAPALMAVMAQYAPALASRVDPCRFSLLGPLDVLAGDITPTVRQGWARLADGRLALAIGDAWIVNDPILGQGANIGSHCAWAVAQALAAGPTLDEQLGQRLEDELWAFAGPVTALNNAFLGPPPPHVLDLLAAASAHQAVADAFVAGFADPVQLAHTLASPVATAALVAAATTRPAAA